MRLLKRLLAALRDLLEALCAPDPRHGGSWHARANEEGNVEIRPK